MSEHKIIAGIIILALIGSGYYGYKKLTDNSGEIRYVLASVEEGTISSSVSGSGQVSVSQQVDIKAKVSGDIISVGVKKGQAVKSGAVLVQLDNSDAQKTVRDAEINLESAKLSLEKLQKPADKLSVLQAEIALTQAKRDLEELKKPPDALELLKAENALAQAKEAKTTAEDNLKKAYDDGFNTVANAFIDLSTIVVGLHNILYAKTMVSDKENTYWYLNQLILEDTKTKAVKYQNDSHTAYIAAEKSYNNNFNTYKSASRTSSDAAVLEKLISTTYETTKIVADAVKSVNNYIDFVQDDMEDNNVHIPTAVTTHQTSLDTYTTKTNSHIANLLTMQHAIQTDKEAIVDADRSIAEKTEALEDLKNGADEDEIKTAEEKISEKEEALAKLKAGPDELDVRSQELTIKQREHSLSDAKEEIADYSIRAPFGGIVAGIDLKKGDSVSANAVVATFITKQRVAEISLNEVDVAKVQLDQKAILTFDAVPDLSITGKVAEIDIIGTVSQGVVSYNVKITFDTQDERVKPSMSVSANIITDVKSDVLMVLNSAVKSQGDVQFVEMPSEQEKGLKDAQNSVGVMLTMPTRRQSIAAGISNDDFTEIVSGLKEGDIVVANTIKPQSNSTKQQSGGFRIPGMSGPPPGGGR